MGDSRQHLFHHIPMYIRQPEVASGVAVGETFVVESEQVQHRRVQVMDVDFVLHCFVVVSRAVVETTLYAASGHPHREGVVVVVAPISP